MRVTPGRPTKVTFKTPYHKPAKRRLCLYRAMSSVRLEFDDDIVKFFRLHLSLSVLTVRALHIDVLFSVLVYVCRNTRAK